VGLLSRRFRDEVVVVTGGGSGIGRATAHAFARLQANVVVVDIQGVRAEEVAAELRLTGAQASAHEVDVRDPEAVERMAVEVFRRHRRVDVLVNNAGVAHSALVQETTLEDWHWVIDTNLWGVIHGVHSFVPRMIDQGGRSHMVNVASVAGLVGVPSLAPYCASKFAVVGMSESLGAELAPYGIRVSTICPGVVATDIIRAARIEGSLGSRKRKLVELYVRRGLAPDRVAREIVDAVRAGRPLVGPLGHTRPAVWLRNLSPRLYRATAGLAFGRILGSKST
jgi:NAD(P)-dependent dehydrogenase (short-subunit alcohol dehydrogenase family)